MKISFTSACVAVAFLTACQSVPTAPTKEKSVQKNPEKTALQRESLWMDGSLRETATLPLSVIRADSDRVTFSWSGDAVELLSTLSRARGQTFSYTGIRLPLPVDIEVQGVTYANVLRIIEMQTAWRATLVTYPGQMVLQFMPSLPAEPVRFRKGGRR